MELKIQAENAEDLRYKIVSLAKQFDAGQVIPAPTPLNRVNKLPPPPKTVEPEAESIFGGEAGQPEPAPTPTKKGKKAAPVVEDVEPTTDEEAVAAVSEFTREQLADKLRTVISKCGGNAAREMMTKLGHSHVSKVPESEFGAFMAECDKYLKSKSKK